MHTITPIALPAPDLHHRASRRQAPVAVERDVAADNRADAPRDHRLPGGGCPLRLGRPRVIHSDRWLARPPTRPTAPPPAFGLRPSGSDHRHERDLLAPIGDRSRRTDSCRAFELARGSAQSSRARWWRARWWRARWSRRVAMLFAREDLLAVFSSLLDAFCLTGFARARDARPHAVTPSGVRSDQLSRRARTWVAPLVVATRCDSSSRAHARAFGNPVL